MLPDVVGALYGKKDAFVQSIDLTARRINSRNASVYWKSSRNAEYVSSFLLRHRDVERGTRPELLDWIARFASDRDEAAYDYWYEIHRGIHQSLDEQ